MGLLDSILEPILGGSSAAPSGAFPRLGELGSLTAGILADNLKTPVADSERFLRGISAIEDVTGRAAGRARQRVGDAATLQGSFDSGARQESLRGIDEAEFAETSRAAAQLFAVLERQRIGDVFPFLQLGSGEQQFIQSSQDAARMGNLQFLMGAAQLGQGALQQAHSAELNQHLSSVTPSGSR
jgi:hypothetical protein